MFQRFIKIFSSFSESKFKDSAELNRILGNIWLKRILRLIVLIRMRITNVPLFQMFRLILTQTSCKCSHNGLTFVLFWTFAYIASFIVVVKTFFVVEIFWKECNINFAITNFSFGYALGCHLKGYLKILF